MARGRSSRGAARSPSSIATSLPTRDPLADVLRPLSLPDIVSDSLHNLSLSDVEDGRAWSPDPVRPRTALEIGGRPARVVVHRRPIVARSQPIYSYRGLPVGLQPPVGVKFESPLRVIRCLRRKIRRNVIFALNKHKKGAGAKRRRRNEYSSVGC